MLTLLYIFLGIITLVAVALLKAYTNIPGRELKRRAASGDDVAGLLFRATAYGASLKMLLWSIILLSGTGFFVILGRSASPTMASVASLLLLWFAFTWIPFTRVSGFGVKLAKVFAPPLAWLTRQLYPLLNGLTKLFGRWQADFHSGLYEKEDLVELLDAQASQADNRVDQASLLVAKNALVFGDKIVRDIMIHPKKMRAVYGDDAIGPILMTELHDSGYSRFPVYEDKKSDQIIGILFLRDLMDVRSGGLVRDLMKPELYYLHDEDPLDQALQSFLVTRHHLAMVVNSFEDVVGMVTIDDVLEQLLGHPLDDDFRAYDDPKAVARERGRRRTKRVSSTKEEQTVVESEEI